MLKSESFIDYGGEGQTVLIGRLRRVLKGTDDKEIKKRFSEEQMIGFLKEPDACMPVGDLCRTHGFTDASYCKWKAKSAA
jgi:hypothetical protein